MALAMTEPVFLRDEYTGAVVRDPMGTPIVIGETPVRPPLSYMGTPAMSYAGMGYPAATPMMAPIPLHPPIVHHPSSYGYHHGYSTGCCAGGLAGVGCCICCDSCCRDCEWCCQDCCYGCYY